MRWCIWRYVIDPQVAPPISISVGLTPGQYRSYVGDVVSIDASSIRLGLLSDWNTCIKLSYHSRFVSFYAMLSYTTFLRHGTYIHVLIKIVKNNWQTAALRR